MIELKHISKTFHTKDQAFHALTDVNLTVNTGDILGIVGYSGAGKSTLVRIINGLVKPTGGEVIIDDINLFEQKKQAIDRMRHKIGMIFQDFNLFLQLDVYQNIKLALDIGGYSGNKDERIRELLELVGLTDKKEAYPAELSGGQQQRVAIARAIANHPDYLLCDEATSALDLKTANEILVLLKDIQLKTNVTILLITHQIEAVRKICNKVAIMHEGSIIEEGQIVDVFMHPKTDIAASLVKPIIDIKHEKHVYELIYKHDPNETALLSQTAKKFDVDFNIIHAHVLEIGDTKIGYLYVKINGKETEEALAHLRDKGLDVTHYDSV